jgi:hypothetical protein
MTNFITTPSRALAVIISDNCDIPTPNLLAIGLNTTDVASKLIDSNAEFIKNGVNLVNVGDVVYCYTTNKAATIIKVADKFSLILNADVFEGNTDIDYLIYQQSPLTGSQNEGCLLYFEASGVIGRANVTTAGNDVVRFYGLSSGVLPVKVKKLWADGTVNISSPIALW